MTVRPCLDPRHKGDRAVAALDLYEIRLERRRFSISAITSFDKHFR
jgi:hypothetical protein